MNLNPVDHFLNLAGYLTNQIEKTLSKTKEVNLIDVIKFNSEQEAIKLINEHHLLDKINAKEFNHVYRFNGVKETVLHHCLNEKKFDLFSVLLNYKEIDYTQTNHNYTLLQSATTSGAYYTDIQKLIMATPKENLNYEKELLPLIIPSRINFNSMHYFPSTSNNKNEKLRRAMELRKTITQYVLKSELDVANLVLTIGDNNFDMLSYCQNMGNAVAIFAILDTEKFSTEQLKKFFNQKDHLWNLDKTQFEAYLIRQEKKDLENLINEPLLTDQTKYKSRDNFKKQKI